MNNQNDDYINFNDIMSDITFDEPDFEPESKKEKLYQVQGQNNEPNAILQFIGYNPHNDRPCYVLQEFDFNKHKCKIVTYVLSESDIEFANKSCELKMLSLLITKKDSVKAAITLSFYCFEHLKNKKQINEYISFDNNPIKINGFFQFNLVTDGNKEKIGQIIDVYKGTSKSIYTLIELLSDEKLKKIWLK